MQSKTICDHISNLETEILGPHSYVNLGYCVFILWKLIFFFLILVLASCIPYYQQFVMAVITAVNVKDFPERKNNPKYYTKKKSFYCTKVTWKISIQSGTNCSVSNLVPEHPISSFCKQNGSDRDVGWNHSFDTSTKTSVPMAHMVFWSHRCIKRIKMKKRNQ